jgi:hypothetical protein
MSTNTKENFINNNNNKDNNIINKKIKDENPIKEFEENENQIKLSSLSYSSTDPLSTIIPDYTQSISKFNKHLPEIVFQNFIYEIGSYLLKYEKINLRILNKSFSENIFPLYKTSINIKSRDKLLNIKLDLNRNLNLNPTNPNLNLNLNLNPNPNLNLNLNLNSNSNLNVNLNNNNNNDNEYENDNDNNNDNDNHILIRENKNANEKKSKININPEKLFQNFCIIEKINIENNEINDILLNKVIPIFKINSKKIKSLTLANLEYCSKEYLKKFKEILFTLQNLEEFKIKSIGNKDLLISEIQDEYELNLSLGKEIEKEKEKERYKKINSNNDINIEINKINNINNNNYFNFLNNIKNLKIDNIPLEQIIFLLNSLTNLQKLTIEYCCIDEDLQNIEKILNKKSNKEKEKEKENKIYTNKDNNNIDNNNKYFDLKYLNLSYNGLSSSIALNSLKKILSFHNGINTIILKGMWFSDIYSLNEEFRIMEDLTTLDFAGSKNIFNGQYSGFAFCEIKNLKILNLGDTRMKDNNLFSILQSCELKKNKSLEELNFFRCFLTDDSIDNILKFKNTLSNLKVLNMTFNHGITEKGFNKLLEKIHLLPSLKILNLRNTGICLKYSLKNISNFILNIANKRLINKENLYTNHIPNTYNFPISNLNNLNMKNIDLKNKQDDINNINNNIIYCIELIDLSFCTIYDKDYYDLINDNLNNLKAYFIPGYLNLKILLKINNYKKAIVQKVENQQDELYKNYNLSIK